MHNRVNYELSREIWSRACFRYSGYFKFREIPGGDAFSGAGKPSTWYVPIYDRWHSQIDDRRGSREISNPDRGRIVQTAPFSFIFRDAATFRDSVFSNTPYFRRLLRVFNHSYVSRVSIIPESHFYPQSATSSQLSVAIISDIWKYNRVV